MQELQFPLGINKAPSFLIPSLSITISIFGVRRLTFVDKVCNMLYLHQLWGAALLVQ